MSANIPLRDLLARHKQFKQALLIAQEVGPHKANSHMIESLVRDYGVKGDYLKIVKVDSVQGYKYQVDAGALTGFYEPPLLFINGEFVGDTEILKRKRQDKSLASDLLAAGLVTEDDIKEERLNTISQNRYNYPKGFCGEDTPLLPGGEVEHKLRYNVVLGVAGSSAADKTTRLLKELKKIGCDVKLVPTRAGSIFINWKSKEIQKEVQEQDIYTDADEWNFEYEEHGQSVMACHLALRDWADCVLVAPATCNHMGHVANGTATNMLQGLCLAWPFNRKPMIFAPACNADMWANPAVQRNVAFLKKMNIYIAGPRMGLQSNGKMGLGNMEDVEALVNLVQLSLDESKTAQWNQMKADSGISYSG